MSRYTVMIQVVDGETEEIVARGSTGIPDEKRVNKSILGMEMINEDWAEAELWNVMTHFRNNVQPKLEAPVEVEEETI